MAPHVAELIDAAAFDLDRAFETAHGDIDHFIAAHGYANYATANVETYLAHRLREQTVVALSSGFMVYPESMHPAIRGLQQEIAVAATTVLLLPSLDLETCVLETVRRQVTRPLPSHRTATREEVVIRERFAQYRGLTPRVVTTMQPVRVVAREIVAYLAEASA